LNDLIIEVKNLTKKFKNFYAVKDLDLNVYRGDIFSFLGPNGAGKSTTIRMLLSLIKPTTGTIKIFGKDIVKYRNEILRNVGAIVEKPDFYLYLTAYKNLEILGKTNHCDVSKRRIMEILELVGLEDRFDSKVKTYSHGMKQRLGIAQTLLHNPELIILDEPTTGLDPQGMKEIRDLIINLSKEQKKTIFLSTHLLSEVEIVASRMIIISKGMKKVEGYVQELLNANDLKVVFDVAEPVMAKQIIQKSPWSEKLIDSAENKVIFNLAEEEISRLNRFLVENQINVNSIIPSRSLEEYFLKITQGE
jgi:ABC-type multidrug transport system ATPase subunit